MLRERAEYKRKIRVKTKENINTNYKEKSTNINLNRINSSVSPLTNHKYQEKYLKENDSKKLMNSKSSSRILENSFIHNRTFSQNNSYLLDNKISPKIKNNQNLNYYNNHSQTNTNHLNNTISVMNNNSNNILHSRTIFNDESTLNTKDYNDLENNDFDNSNNKNNYKNNNNRKRKNTSVELNSKNTALKFKQERNNIKIKKVDIDDIIIIRHENYKTNESNKAVINDCAYNKKKKMRNASCEIINTTNKESFKNSNYYNNNNINYNNNKLNLNKNPTLNINNPSSRNKMNQLIDTKITSNAYTHQKVRNQNQINSNNKDLIKQNEFKQVSEKEKCISNKTNPCSNNSNSNNGPNQIIENDYQSKEESIKYNLYNDLKNTKKIIYKNNSNNAENNNNKVDYRYNHREDNNNNNNNNNKILNENDSLDNKYKRNNLSKSRSTERISNKEGKSVPFNNEMENPNNKIIKEMKNTFTNDNKANVNMGLPLYLDLSRREDNIDNKNSDNPNIYSHINNNYDNKNYYNDNQLNRSSKKEPKMSSNKSKNNNINYTNDAELEKEIIESYKQSIEKKNFPNNKEMNKTEIYFKYKNEAYTLGPKESNLVEHSNSINMDISNQINRSGFLSKFNENIYNKRDCDSTKISDLKIQKKVKGLNKNIKFFFDIIQKKLYSLSIKIIFRI